MFVCIVMDYYKMGDLDRVLRKKRSKKEEIEELVSVYLFIIPYVTD